LKKRLFGLATGEVTEVGPLAALLAGCWREFAGGDQGFGVDLYEPKLAERRHFVKLFLESLIHVSSSGALRW
jgi:hypothetical protein